MGGFFDLLAWVLRWKHAAALRGTVAAGNTFSQDAVGMVVVPGSVAGNTFCAGPQAGEVHGD